MKSFRVSLRILPAILLLLATQAARPAPPQSAGSKAAWEPLNYPKDINIRDIFFVDESIGWIAGGRAAKGGFVMNTTDGGASWTLQAGDPDGEDRDYTHLRFVDETHGWVVQRTSVDANLFATQDGQQWDLVSKLPEHFDDIIFVSRTDGFYVNDDKIFATHDGGTTWSEVLHAVPQVEVNGLTRSVKPYFYSIVFPSPSDGYAVGGSYEAPGIVILFRTQDAGETWTQLAHAIGDGLEATFFFTDPGTGCLRLRQGNIFTTTDGGESWRGVPGTAGPLLRFADPEVGWSFYYKKFSYSVDGGKRWTSREIPFPQPVQAFSFPNREVAYVAGDHGMIYRYRLLGDGPPAKRAIPAVAMPPLTADVEPTADELSEDLAELNESLGAAQETPAPPSAGTGAVDAATKLPFIQRCCKTQLAQISTLIQNLVRDTPQIIGKYRNLNLISLGLKLALELPSQIEGIQSAFAELKKAPDAKSALAASGNLATAVDAFRASLNGEGSDTPQASAE